MRPVLAVLAITLLAGCLLPGCTVLSAIGGAVGITSPTDLAPSLRYCQEVQYHRKGIDAELRAKCTIPAG